MTQQVPDILIYQGDRLPLLTYPLDEYFKFKERPRFVSRSTDNRRGYVASWTIVENCLLLTSLSGRICVERGDMVCRSEDCRMRGPTCSTTEANLSELFGRGPVLADWFSGELRVPAGRRCTHRHMSMFPEYEQYQVWAFCKGISSGPFMRSNDDYKREAVEREEAARRKTRGSWLRWLRPLR